MASNKVTVAVATKAGGILLTSDNKRSMWHKSKKFLESEDLNKIIVDSNGRLFAATLTEGVFRKDPGEIWKPYSRGLNVRKVWSIATDPENDSVIYAGTQYGHLFKSEDSARSWNEVTGLHNAPHRLEWGIDWGFGTTGLTIHTILLDPAIKNRIYIVASGNGPYRSDDGGETWGVLKDGVTDSCPVGSRRSYYPGESADPEERSRKHLEQVHSCTHKMVLSGKEKGQVFQQNHCGVFASENSGDSWTDISPGDDLRHGFPIDLVLDHKPNLFVIPASQNDCKIHNTCIQGKLRVFRSDSNGKTWNDSSGMLPEDVHTNVLRDAMTHDDMEEPGLYFGTTAGEVFYSPNLGESWVQIAAGLGRIQGLTAFSSFRQA